MLTKTETVLTTTQIEVSSEEIWVDITTIAHNYQTYLLRYFDGKMKIFHTKC